MSDRAWASVVVTGAAGSYGRVLVPWLLERGYEVHGVDRRPWPARPEALAFHQVDVLKRGFEEVLRRAPGPPR